MQITLEINTEFEPNDYQRRILLALAGEGSAKALAAVAADHREHVHLANEIRWQDPTPVTEKGRKEALEELAQHLPEVVAAAQLQEAQGDAQQGHPELHRAFAEENAAAAAAEQEGDEQEGDEDTSGLPRHPDGRIVGRAPEGKKRRTKAQIAEDEAWEAAQSANEASDRAPVPDEEPEPPSAGGLIPQQAPQVAQDTTGEPEQAAQTPPQDQEASSPWSW